MKEMHVNDSELQQYALDKSDPGRHISGHIVLCEHCRAKAMQYEKIISGLQQQPGLSFDFNVAAIVLKTIKQSEEKKMKFSWSGLIITALCIPGIIMITYAVHLIRQDISAFIKVGTGSPVYLILAVAGILLLTGVWNQYGQYRRKLEWIGL